MFFQIAFGLLGATLFYPDTAPISCSYERCQVPFAYAFVVLATLSYLIVIVLYAILVFRIHRQSRILNRAGGSGGGGSGVESDGLQNDSVRERAMARARNVRTINRLSMSMCTFSMQVFCAAHI